METLWDCCYSTKKWAPCQNDTKSTTKTHQLGKETTSNDSQGLEGIFGNGLTSLLMSPQYVNHWTSRVSNGTTPRRKPLHTKNDIAACLKFAKEHTDIPQQYWQNVLWTNETKIEQFGKNTQHNIWRRWGTAYHNENIFPTVKYGGGNIMIWASFAASGPDQLGIIEGKINPQAYQTILQDDVRMSVSQLKLCRRCVMQQNNDPKHQSKSTTEWLQRNKICLMEWPSQSPDLNPIELLWIDLKRAIHMRRLNSMTELKQFCQEEWAKIPPQLCAGLIHSYRKRLVEVTGGSTTY